MAVRGGVQLGAASCTSMSLFCPHAPEAGPVFTSSQLKYRSHRALLVFFGFHRNFSERDFSGSGQLDVPHGAKVPIGSSQSP